MQTFFESYLIRRFARCEEIAELVVYLSSPAAAYVTGANWVTEVATWPASLSKRPVIAFPLPASLLVCAPSNIAGLPKPTSTPKNSLRRMRCAIWGIPDARGQRCSGCCAALTKHVAAGLTQSIEPGVRTSGRETDPQRRPLSWTQYGHPKAYRYGLPMRRLLF